MITWTGIEIIKQARYANGSLGEGMVIGAGELSDDLMALNLLLASWDVILYENVQESKTLTANVASYTWGIGGVINTARPIDLLDMTFVRDGDNDYPLTLIRQYSYVNIGDKTSPGRPEKIFFDPSYPLATIYLHPSPDSAYTLYLTSQKGVSEITDATAAINLPMDVVSALKWNLAVHLCPNYGVPVTPVLAQMAQKTEANVMGRAFKYGWEPVKIDNVDGRRSRGDSILNF